MPLIQTFRRRAFTIDAAALIAVAGAAVQLYQWSRARPMWVDEEMIAINLRERSLVDMPGRLLLEMNAPLGWMALQRTWLVAFGTSELALRFVPVVIGIGTLAAGVWMGRRWLGPFGAALLVALCATGAWLSFYSLELKHYSADICLGLLLPGLAAWTLEADAPASRRRVWTWWAVASAGLWFAYGAAFVVPASAAVIVLVVWRRHGWREAVAAAAPGLLWAAALGLHYMTTIRHATGSAFLTNYWAFRCLRHRRAWRTRFAGSPIKWSRPPSSRAAPRTRCSSGWLSASGGSCSFAPTAHSD